MIQPRAGHAIAILLTALLLTGCVSQTIKSTSVPALNRPAEAISELDLLDVGIAIFNPGLEEYDEKDQVYPEVRRAEARFMPQLLAEAMQQSGAWGAVRVLPDNDRITDLRIDGEILYSDGERVELAILAIDSQGNTWLDNTYSARTSRYAYRSATRRQYDPFQALYHRIANDLLQKQAGMSSRNLQVIRTITELRFAREFASGSFEGYLEQTRNGKYRIARLPAEGDPMLERVRTIRKRDHLFVDTLQTYYRDFSGAMYEPYQEWRKMSYEEAVALQELQAQSRRQLIAGGAAILAGIAASGSNDRSMRTAGFVSMMGGGSLLKSGLETRNEARMHTQALEELGLSLEAEITPRVIELDDRSVMLSGNVEDQYNQWRDILEEIYRTEMGAMDAAAADNSTTNRPL